MRNAPLPGFTKRACGCVGACSHSPLKVDLTKKEGLGPRAKQTDTTKYEMGNPLGIENTVAMEKLYEKTEKKRRR